MSILVAVAEAGSLTAAGRRLNVSLPTVSRKLAELETHLGARLLARSTRRLSLTEAGEAYVAACRRILDQIGDAERAAAGEYSTPRGDLIIAAPIVFGRLYVLPVANAFLSNYPDINIRLVLSDRNAHLLDDNIDLAVRIGPLPDSAMVATRVGIVRRVVCGSPNYFAAHGIPNDPADLSALPCVNFDGLGSGTSWTFAGQQTVVTVRPRLSVNTAEAAIDAAIAGVGVTRVLSYQVATAVAEGQLQLVLEAFEPAPLPVSLVHAPQGLLPLKMRKFLDFAALQLRQRLSSIP
jgi:DNA-binding transcriptional LysR family regulator